MTSRVAATVAGLFCVFAAVAPAQRLPAAVVADHYRLHLAPDFDSDTFQGEVTINVHVTAPTTTITLNAAEMQFVETRISSGTTAQSATAAFDARKQTVTLTVPHPVPAGTATIAIRYSAALNTELRGFYLSRGNGRDYAVTQLEPTDARRAFPSFDEPAMKATYDVSTTIDTRDTAISNGRLLSDTPGPGAGKHTLTFSTTPRMSSYLVALVVGDWECVRGGADGTPIRICARPSHKEELGFALKSAEASVRYYNRYFGIKYPFEKLDIVAVPDFSAGAMENIGAIVFREQYLLVNDAAKSVDHLKQVAEFTAHEIAHQWFGDLVTMQWWDDIWLNEGFATWMEKRPATEWQPEWNVLLDEVRDTQRAMNTDSLDNTRAVRTRVETPEEINDVFDAIAYQKTAAVVRMVEAYVGAESYRKAIAAYLKKFSYGNATGEDYWTTIADVARKPVDGILSSFLTQASLPLVRVKTACANGKTEVALAQTPISKAVPASTTWQVPVCYKRSRNGRVEPPACEVLSSASQTLTLDGCSTWLFANVDSQGYYRTAYSPDDVTALRTAVRRKQLSAVEQTSLLEDLWAVVETKREPIASFLSIAEDVAASGVSPAIETIALHLNYISNYLIAPDDRPAFEQWVRKLLRPAADTLGWKPLAHESDERKALRATVLYTLGYAGRDPAVLREARRRVDMYLGSAGDTDPSLFTTVVELAALNGDAALYERYLARSRRANEEGGDARNFRGALSLFPDPDLTKKTLEYATSSEVRSQDTPALLGELLSTPGTAATAWDHVKTHWDTLQRTGMFQGVRRIVGGTANFCDVSMRNDLASFLATHPVSGNERVAQQALERIDRCVGLRDYQSKYLSGFFQQNR
jgi:aminopeptidase N